MTINTMNKLNKYNCSFTGREVGAIGVFFHVNYTVEAKNEELAHLKIYDKYEHLTDVKIELVKE